MFLRPNNTVLDLATDELKRLKPLPRFISLVVFQAMQDSADKIEFSLLDCLPKPEFHISYSAKGKTHEMSPPAICLFAPLVGALCKCASVPCDAKGPVRGRITTKNPESTWLLESQDLKKGVLLSRT